MNITEKDLRPTVEAWLQEQGYYVAHEVMLSGYCDLTGCKWAERIGRRIPPMIEIMAVELKIRDIRGVLYQAKNNRWFVDYSYAAMPLQKCEKMNSSTLRLFKNIGVGLLGVSDCVDVIVKARKKEIPRYSSNICRRLWNFKLRHKIK
jgi:hypothetical protein